MFITPGENGSYSPASSTLIHSFTFNSDVDGSHISWLFRYHFLGFSSVALSRQYSTGEQHPYISVAT